MAFLRDPIWQFIGVIVALTALFIPTVLTILSRRKSLDFEIISDTPILSLKEEDKGQIQVLFNGKPLDNAHLIIMRIWNSGKIPIEIDDYNGQSIKLDFKVEVLDVAILEATPREVKENLAKDKDPAKIELKPILLNSQDSIELKILVNQAVSSIEIDAHIAGAKTAKQISLVSKPRFRPLSRRELMIGTTGLAGWIVAIASIAWFGYIQKPPPPPKAKGSLTPTQMSSPTSTQLIFSFEISDIYRHHTKGVFSVAWSRSGNYIASTGLDKTLQVWVPNGKNDSPLLMEKLFDTGESVTWSPDERYIATGDDSGFVRIWDLQQ